MDFRLIETFIILSETLNLTKTSEILFVSQSTVSNRLKSIERETGTKLFYRDRGYKQIELTTEGNEFLEIAREYNKLHKKIKTFSSKSFKQIISIGTITSINNFLLNKLYNDLLNNSNLQLKINTEHAEEIYRQVASRQIDIGFITRYIAFPQIDYSELTKEVMVVVTKNKGHLKSVEPKDLDPKEQIYFDWGDQYAQWHNEQFSHHASPKISLDSQILAVNFLKNDSWLIAPISVANALMNMFDGLQLIPFKDNPPIRTIFMITHQNPLKSNLEIIDRIQSTVELHISE